ncbi:hypothetical protein QCA50_006611 [Cerrena zonata]|uniref:Uncharacterized protein n=1 Tax=Cerrena zonata TaxID=2478898 RepID=A0AAW0GKA8_9APHY
MPLPTYMQPPPEFPILLPPGIPLMPYMDPNTTGSCCSMYKDDTCQSSGTLSSRIGGFLVELSSMPWISERVVDEYIPGQRSGSHNKNSSSWYSVRAPASPSDISSKWRMVPDPWFAPRNLPVTQEEPEPIVGGAGDEQEQEHVGQEVRELREEVQEKTREVDTLQQTVEHQKKHIAALEDELEQLKGLQVESPDLRGRRSSTRLYRKRDSVRTVTSVIRSVSRPPSIL